MPKSSPILVSLSAALIVAGCGRGGEREGNAASSARKAPVTANAATGNASAEAAVVNRAAQTPVNVEGGEDESYGRELPEGSANLDFIVVNRTGQTITAIDITPAGEESWSRDIMVQRDLPDQERSAVSYSRDVEQCSWDVRATFEAGHKRSWPRINCVRPCAWSCGEARPISAP